MKTQADFVKTALRLPPDLHALLHAAAAEGERTFNAEIIYRLRQTFKGARKIQNESVKNPKNKVEK